MHSWTLPNSPELNGEVIIKTKLVAIGSLQAPWQRISQWKKRRSATEESCAKGKLS
jgi:hypothetical protein